MSNLERMLNVRRLPAHPHPSAVTKRQPDLTTEKEPVADPISMLRDLLSEKDLKIESLQRMLDKRPPSKVPTFEIRITERDSAGRILSMDAKPKL